MRRQAMNVLKVSIVLPALIAVCSLSACSGSGDGAASTQVSAVAMPVFSIPGGTYTTDQSIAISSLTPDATIRYTTDGSPPTVASALYAGPISVAGNGVTMTITAIAVKAGMTDSPVISATYTITYSQSAAVPTFTPPAGTYSSDQSVTINCATSGAVIYYTTDGSTPTTASAVYGGAIPVSGNGTSVTITAMAIKPGLANSAAASATYTINSVSNVVFAYPPLSAGGLIQSSYVSPNGSDQDMYAYDDFTLTSTQSITAVSWRGGYIQNAFGGHVTSFTITFFESIAGGSQPHVVNPQQEDTNPVYLVKYTVGGNGGETLAGVFGGTTMYDYRFVLPSPFVAVAGTKYWLRIEASQNTLPDWGIAVGTGGDGQYFRFSTGLATFQMIPAGDTAFQLLK